MVRTVVGWLFTALCWPLILGLHFLLLKRTPERWLVALIHFWGWSALRITGVRLVLENPSTIATPGSRVVVANHQSGLELATGAAIYAPGTLAIGKREILYVPLINLIWWGLDFIRIDRSNHTTAVAALEGVAREVVRHRRTLILAPEGTRSVDGNILPFKKGAFHIAIEAQVPIHPIVIAGARECLPRHGLVIRPGEVRIRFLPPVETKGKTRADLDALRDAIRETMIREYEALRARVGTGPNLP